MKSTPLPGMVWATDHDWLFVDGSGHGTSIDDCLDVVAIYLYDMPAKGFPLALKVFERHDVLGKTVDLDVVAVSDSDNVIELVFARPASPLPKRCPRPVHRHP